MVKVHVVSDVHGSSAALARAAEGSDLFVCLGDLILFLDYDDPTQGIYTDLFGADHTRAYIEARTAGRFEDARALSADAWARRGVIDPTERWAAMRDMVRVQYEALFAAMPAPALLTFGNVDVPDLWPEYVRPGHRVLDGQAVTEHGVRMGFVGGGMVSPMRTPYELTEEQYATKLGALGPVDVLFTHIPPLVPELTYDTVARRFEFGNAALLEYIRDVQPEYHLFGHVHQPLRSRMRIGRTECINVGHFHSRLRPYVLSL
ncbi:MAG: metallophosphoesterase [Actinobacteria bacterium]|nr:metallophosphoesterase [Actinomycetota bacterium]